MGEPWSLNPKSSAIPSQAFVTHVQRLRPSPSQAEQGLRALRALGLRFSALGFKVSGVGFRVYMGLRVELDTNIGIC